jgi:hypothetical protein
VVLPRLQNNQMTLVGAENAAEQRADYTVALTAAGHHDHHVRPPTRNSASRTIGVQ